MSASNNGLGFDTWVWGAQILVQNSSDVEVSGNTAIVSASRGIGIAIVSQERGTGDRGRYVSARVTVTDNTIHDLLESRVRTGCQTAVAMVWATDLG